MRASDLLTSAMERRGLTQKELAEALGAKKATFCKHISENALRAQELIDAAEYMGCRVVLLDAETEDEVKVIRKGVGPRVRKQIDGVVYDTEKANAICNTETVNGWWMELYETLDGVFFAAHYTDWPGVENFITLCPPDEAERLRSENDPGRFAF